MPADKSFCERFLWLVYPFTPWADHPTLLLINIDKCQAVRQWANYPTDFGRIPLDSLLPFSFEVAPLRPS